MRRESWDPDRLRAHREGRGLTLEGAAEALRVVASQHGLNVAANFQTISAHERGQAYPGPHYRRAYALLFDASEPELGFRAALPGELQRVAARAGVGPDGDVLPATLRAMAGDPGSGTHEALVSAAQAARDRETHDPVLVAIGGFAGSGKSELAGWLASVTHWPLLDKDDLTRQLVESLLSELGCDPGDRHSPCYQEKVRPLEYRCLMAATWANLERGNSTIVTAPFIGEFRDAAWLRRVEQRCHSLRVSFIPIWVVCDAESMLDYLTLRGAGRDAWKLGHWHDYLASLDFRTPSAVAAWDNTCGQAVALADRFSSTPAAAILAPS